MPPGANNTTQAPARKRRGFPVVPTIMVALAVPMLAGLGVWQLQRHTWKEGLLATYARNIDAAEIDLDGHPFDADMQFRNVSVTIHCPAAPSVQRAGRSLRGEAGFSHFLACTAGGQPLELNAGWSARTGPQPLPEIDAPVRGLLLQEPAGGWLLVARDGVPPLGPSLPPGPDTIPNNHLMYAIQWFAFALVLLLIYGVWLKRWLAQPPSSA